MMTMATTNTNKPISVVRIPRTYSNQIVPNDVYEVRNKVALTTKPVLNSYPEADDESLVYEPARTHVNEENLRVKTDVFTLAFPQSSIDKYQDSKEEHHFQQKPFSDSSRPSMVIQHQPESSISLMKPSSEFHNRPNLNWKFTKPWKHGLCTLCDDFNLFCYACSCWCCFRYELSKMMGEHCCSWFAQCLPLLTLRTKFRQQYRIRGSIAEDCCLACCCPLCVALQIANEGRHYGHRIFT